MTQLNKRLQEALNNIDVIVSNTRLNRQEHAQLLQDVELIKVELTKKVEKNNKQGKKE